MPKKFKSRAITRRKPPRQPAWKKMVGIATSAVDLAKNIPGPIGMLASTVSGIKNLINVEAKYVDNTFNGNVSSSGSVTPLTLIAQGTTDQTRSGNSVLAKSLDIKSWITSASAGVQTIIRIALILDKQNAQGTAPTMAQIYQGVEYNSSFLNKDNSDRFVVLHDERFTLGTGGPQSVAHEHHLNLNDLHVLFDGSAATQANATENHIYLVMSSASQSVGDPAVYMKTRFNFYDN